MTVLYPNTRLLSAQVEKSLRAAYVSMDELLSRADILALHTPYSRATHHIMKAAKRAWMKPGTILIDAAHGGVVDETTLLDALPRGAIAGVGLDIFENEPALRPEFLKLTSVDLTPPVASASETTHRNMAMLAVEHLVAALTTGQPPNLFNP